MSDLLDPVSVAYYADLVVFLHRDMRPEGPGGVDEAELYLAKNRHGDTGAVRLTFEREFCRFKNLN